MLPRAASAALLLSLILAGETRAWIVQRSLASPGHPAVLTWEFFQESASGPWDSLEITLVLKPNLPVGARTLSWSPGPWAVMHPVLQIDSGAMRIMAWRRSGSGGDSGKPVPIAALSVELRVDSAPSFAEVEASMRIRGYGPGVTVTRKLPWGGTVAGAGPERPGPWRDALGRRSADLAPPLLLEWERQPTGNLLRKN